MKRIFLTVTLACFALAATCAQSSGNAPVKVIFDTDMGNDIDDALALDMLYKYMEDGKVELLGITSNKDEMASVEYIDIMNNFYGHPDMPVGKITDGPDCKLPRRSYVSVVAQDKSYKRSVKDYNALPESVDLMRRLLAKEKDGSVVIISVGFSTNLSRLLASGPDKYSKLSGRELAAKKVKSLVMMAGDFRPEGKHSEYNIRIDKAAAQNVFKNWPTMLVTSPFEVGMVVKYPASSIQNDFKFGVKHPVVEGYKAYKQMPYDRETWDMTSVLYAIEPGYFGCSAPGRIVVTDDSKTIYTADPEGNRAYLTIVESQYAPVLKRFIELITRKPESLRK